MSDENQDSNYGWQIERGQEWEAFADALEAFGAEALIQDMARAIGRDDLRESLQYIFRMHAYKSPYLVGQESETVEE